MKKRKKTLTVFITSISIIGILWFAYNYKNLSGEDSLIAGREFGISFTQLTLKDNGTLIEVRDGLIFNEKTYGKYQVKQDTIFFESYSNNNHSYSFGLLELSKFGKVLNLFNDRSEFENQLDLITNNLIK